ncbi:MAG: hypothetical protein IPP83_11730 [Flavobacteriales bacterium]|nr:hypothetical protein [Flavobacteriales bacterium]
MKPTRNLIGPATMVMLLLGSCASSQQVGQFEDDVYYVPSAANATQPKPVAEVTPPATADDYYDPNTASTVGTSRGYYDMTYNDPYFYNYGRFGFGMGSQTGWSGSGWGSGMGYQTGWNGPGWGSGMQWGYGSGVYSGWYRPTISFGYGWGSQPWGGYYSGMGWNQFAWYNDPYYGGYGGGMGGYGYGNYWGPWGNCYSGYSPIVIAGSANHVVGHRPSLGVGNNRSNGTYQARSSFRDPVALTRTPYADRIASERRTINSDRPGVRGGSTVNPHPEQRPNVIGTPGQRPAAERTIRMPRATDHGGTMERGGGVNRGGGGSPSRSGGGGGMSPGVRRAR